MSHVNGDPKDLLNEGAARAKNMGVAVVMICVLLTKYFAVKVVWKRIERVLAILVVRMATVLNKLYVLALPYLERFRLYVIHTKNKTIRLTLGLVILILTPIEGALLRFFGVAKVQSERLAVQGTNSAISAVVPILKSIGSAIKNGLSKPAMQRALARLLELVEEAQKV